MAHSAIIFIKGDISLTEVVKFMTDILNLNFDKIIDEFEYYEAYQSEEDLLFLIYDNHGFVNDLGVDFESYKMVISLEHCSKEKNFPAIKKGLRH